MWYAVCRCVVCIVILLWLLTAQSEFTSMHTSYVQEMFQTVDLAMFNAAEL